MLAEESATLDLSEHPSVWRTLRASLTLLSRRELAVYVVLVTAQIALTVLDLAALAVLGVAINTTLNSDDPVTLPAVMQRYLPSDPQSLVTISVVLAAGLLLSRSVLGLALTRATFRFLAGVQNKLSERLAVQALPILHWLSQQWPSQWISYALMNGATAASQLTLGQFAVVVSEAAVILALCSVALVTSPTISAILFIGLGLAFVINHRLLRRRLQAAGNELAISDIESLERIQEAISSSRELLVYRAEDKAAEAIAQLRARAAYATASQSTLTLAPKYVLELALVLVAAVGLAVLGVAGGSEQAVASVILLVIIGIRLLPSLVRIQSALFLISLASASAEYALKLMALLAKAPSSPIRRDETKEFGKVRALANSLPLNGAHDAPGVELRGVEFWYPNADRPALTDLSFDIAPGSLVAVLGRSGAGKSTLVDLLLGIARPSRGSVLIGGVRPDLLLSSQTFPVSYVSQSVYFGNRTIRECVAMDADSRNDDAIWEALNQVGLAERFSLGHGLDARVGESGKMLSGGERQRLSIARALYHKPLLLLMDEPTSSLDVRSESIIVSLLEQLRSRATVVVVAHRLSTVQHADRVVMLEKGRLRHAGSFAQLSATAKGQGWEDDLFDSP